MCGPTTDSDAVVAKGAVAAPLPWWRFGCDLELNAFMIGYIGGCHMLAMHALLVLLWFGGRDELLAAAGEAVGVPQLAAPVKSATLWFAFALWPVSALGITAGCHRLWAHRSYEAHFLLRLFLLLCNSAANQGPIFHWARDHRVHHLHSDTERDPHDSNRGFFYSHVGWLLVKKPRAVIDAGRKLDLADLYRDPILMFQKRLDPWWNFAWCFAAPAIVATTLWEESLWNGFLFAGVLRYVWLLHCTWSVNSIVHAFGPRPYDPDHDPRENGLVAFLAIGEGWHCWHHAFAFDYATSELGCLQQFNPTKCFIDSMALLGLATGRKRATRQWEARKELWSKRLECKGLRLQESLRGPPLFRHRIIEEVPIDKAAALAGAGAADPAPLAAGAGGAENALRMRRRADCS